MKPSTPFSLSTLLLLVALMATLAAFGGFAPAQASKQSSLLPLKATTQTSTSGRIQGGNLRRGDEYDGDGDDDDLSMAASSSTSASAQQQQHSSKSSSSSSNNADSLPEDNKESALEPRGLESNIANAKIKLSANDMATAAGSHHGKSHGKYYMYAEVPKKKSYKMGFKRGNEKHLIERKESAHKSHVHSYFKWHDKKGKGSHKFEFKHEGKGKKGHY